MDEFSECQAKQENRQAVDDDKQSADMHILCRRKIQTENNDNQEKHECEPTLRILQKCVKRRNKQIEYENRRNVPVGQIAFKPKTEVGYPVQKLPNTLG
jgi:hypothetical protein